MNEKTAYERYKSAWNKKTTREVEKELESMRKYVNKNSRAYSWHGKGITPPGSMADGDKILTLMDILDARKKGEE